MRKSTKKGKPLAVFRWDPRTGKALPTTGAAPFDPSVLGLKDTDGNLTPRGMNFLKTWIRMVQDWRRREETEGEKNNPTISPSQSSADPLLPEPRVVQTPGLPPCRGSGKIKANRSKGSR